MSLATVIPQSGLRDENSSYRAFPHTGGGVSVLTSWKDIARYLGKGVRTVQRWERDFGLPVRRPLGSNKKAVLARPHDLDAWVAMRCSSRAERAATPVDKANLSIDSLALLACGIETARVLRSCNQALLNELTESLDALRAAVVAFPRMDN
ncbi:MAG: helix-turn-helix transcriptional regulator [Acidobacteriota bacterium]